MGVTTMDLQSYFRFGLGSLLAGIIATAAPYASKAADCTEISARFDEAYNELELQIASADAYFNSTFFHFTYDEAAGVMVKRIDMCNKLISDLNNIAILELKLSDSECQNNGPSHDQIDSAQNACEALTKEATRNKELLELAKKISLGDGRDGRGDVYVDPNKIQIRSIGQ
jgi:hypothetical protein